MNYSCVNDFDETFYISEQTKEMLTQNFKGNRVWNLGQKHSIVQGCTGKDDFHEKRVKQKRGST